MKNRLDRVNELIRRELSELISRTVEGMPAKLVTVREVDISPDLKHASVWMGIIGSDDEQKKSMEVLHAKRKSLQSEMSRRVILKYTPQLHFKLDEAAIRGDRVLNILSALDIPEPPTDEETQDEDKA
jgi:ribosome-binding factor A